VRSKASPNWNFCESVTKWVTLASERSIKTSNGQSSGWVWRAVDAPRTFTDDDLQRATLCRTAKWRGEETKLKTAAEGARRVIPERSRNSR
jgi:hypothetical protein